MSLPPLWMAIKPRHGFTQLLLSQSGTGTLLKARLSQAPSRPGALPKLLEALADWHGCSLFAVLDADAEDVVRFPEKWARMTGEAAANPNITVEWSSPPPAKLWRDRFFEVGDFAACRRLLVRGVTGVR